MKNAPIGHKWVITEDGSMTLYSEKFQENCHSTTGAVIETKLQYLEGCKVQEQYEKHDHLNILEVGFGIGIGALETYKFISPLKPIKKIHYVSLELDENLIKFLITDSQDPLMNSLKKTSAMTYSGLYNEFKITIIIGNARETISSLKTIDPNFYAHCIYQDAFSPKHCPILWTKEWFQDLKDVSSPDVVLSTYSSSVRARKAMFEAGWVLYEGIQFGPKSSSTRAMLQGQTDRSILERMQRSPSPALQDKDLDQE